MTNETRIAIEKLRAAGKSFSEISKITGVPIGTVNSFFYRHTKVVDFCKNCGQKIRQTKGHRQKMFCDEVCKRRWYKKHAEERKLTAWHIFKCECCGTVFTSYGNHNRRFCCRDCYNKGRRINDESEKIYDGSGNAGNNEGTGHYFGEGIL